MTTMGRKLPRDIPNNQIKPDPPPSPPRKKGKLVTHTIEKLSNINVLTAMKKALDGQKMKIIEECCKQMCDLCDCGNLVIRKHNGLYIHKTTTLENSPEFICKAEAIRQHFAEWYFQQEQIKDRIENG